MKTVQVDRTAPSGALTQPAAAATVGGANVSVAATASDPGGSGVTSVTFRYRPAGGGAFTDDRDRHHGAVRDHLGCDEHRLRQLRRPGRDRRCGRKHEARPEHRHRRLHRPDADRGHRRLGDPWHRADQHRDERRHDERDLRLRPRGRPRHLDPGRHLQHRSGLRDDGRHDHARRRRLRRARNRGRSVRQRRLDRPVERARRQHRPVGRLVDARRRRSDRERQLARADRVGRPRLDHAAQARRRRRGLRPRRSPARPPPSRPARSPTATTRLTGWLHDAGRQPRTVPPQHHDRERHLDRAARHDEERQLEPPDDPLVGRRRDDGDDAGERLAGGAAAGAGLPRPPHRSEPRPRLDPADHDPARFVDRRRPDDLGSRRHRRAPLRRAGADRPQRLDERHGHAGHRGARRRVARHPAAQPLRGRSRAPGRTATGAPATSCTS